MAIQKQHNMKKSENQNPNNMAIQKPHTEGKI